MINTFKIFSTILLSILGFSHLDAQHYNHFLSMIDDLEQKYKVKVSYDATLVNEKASYYELQEGEDLNKVLVALFKNNAICYKIIDGNKVLLRKNDEDIGSQFLMGQVWDNASNAPLPFASIYIPGTTRGTISDLDGQFKLNVQGADSVLIQFLGYEEAVIDCKNFSGRIEMNPAAVRIEEVTIYIHPATMGQPGNDHLIYDATNWIEKSSADVFGKDLIRSLQLLPGIAADNDEGGKLRIRGSESDEVLMLLDGIPLYKMDHYYGIFGAINPSFVDEIKLYKNNQPLEHETRTGGILILGSQSEIKEVNGEASADFMKVNGSVNVPVGNIGISLGGRLNHTDPFETVLADNADDVDVENSLIDRENFRRAEIAKAIPVYEFHDLNGKIYWDLHEETRLQLSGITVRDNYQREYENEFKIPINRRIALYNEGFSEFENWKNDGFSLELDHQIDPNTKLTARLYNAYYENYNKVEARIFLRTLEKEFINSKYRSENENKLTTNGIDIFLEQKNGFTLGVKVIDRNNQLIFKENKRTLIRRRQKSREYSSYVSKTFNLNDELLLDFGGKFNYLEKYSLANFSPSLGLTAFPTNNLVLKASYTRLYQNIRELQLETRLGLNQQYFVLADNKGYPQGLAHNYMVGLGWSKGLFGMDIEAYYKHLDGAIGYLPVSPGISATGFIPDISSLFRVYSGVMKSRGLDILLYYDHQKWYSQLAYTLSKSENTFAEIYRGNPFPSQYDRRHQMKWLNSYKITNGFSISNTLVYSSGRPYLAFDKINDAPDRTNIDVNDVIQNLPDYFRMDLSATYTFKIGKTNPFISASLYNVTNHENVKYIQQTFRIRSDARRNNVILGFESPLLERLFNMTAGIQF